MMYIYLNHHVGVGFPGHLFAGVQIKKLVHHGGGQSVSYLQVLHREHLSGYRLLS